MASVSGELVDLVADTAVHPGESATWDRMLVAPLGSLLATTIGTSQAVAASQAIFYGIECSSGAGVLVSIYNGTSSTGVAFFSRAVTSGNGYYTGSVGVACPSGIWFSPSSTALTCAIIGRSS